MFSLFCFSVLVCFVCCCCFFVFCFFQEFRQYIIPVPVVQRADNSIQRINVLVGVHFISWIVIYPLDRGYRTSTEKV